MSKPELSGKKGRCIVCGEVAEGDLCFKHERALEELRSKYTSWKAAFGYNVQEYLMALQKRKETGEWTKELIAYIVANKRFEMLT